MFLFRRVKDIGTIGEDSAVKFLKKSGCKILERNWYNKTGKRLGEIDVICEKDDKIIFIEVKTREVRNDASVIPEEQITRSKLQKLQRAAEIYIKEKALWEKHWQFDAVSIYIKDHDVVKIVHIENIYL